MPMDPKEVKRIAGERLKKMRAEPVKDEADKGEARRMKDHADVTESGASRDVRGRSRPLQAKPPEDRTWHANNDWDALEDTHKAREAKERAESHAVQRLVARSLTGVAFDRDIAEYWKTVGERGGGHLLKDTEDAINADPQHPMRKSPAK